MSDFTTDELIIVRDDLIDLCEDNEVMKETIDTYFKEKYGIYKKDVEDEEYNEYCRQCGIPIKSDITNPLGLCDDCEKELEDNENE